MCIQDEYIKSTLRPRFVSYAMIGATNFNLDWKQNTHHADYYSTVAGRVQFRNQTPANQFIPWVWRMDNTTGEQTGKLTREDVGILYDQIEFRPYADGTLYVVYYDYDPDVYRQIMEMSKR